MKKNTIIISILVVLLILGQKYHYENKLMLAENKIETLEAEISTLISNNNETFNKLNMLEEKYKRLERDQENLTSNIEGLQEALLNIKNELFIKNMPDYWDNLWDEVSKDPGELTDYQIEEINLLLQPVFETDEGMQVNPLSCFFTSYYEDVRNINLDDFLRYFPYGEVPEELPEFGNLKAHENWPFGDSQDITDLPVPIHRYEEAVVKDIFSTYAGISLDALNGVGFDEHIYLRSTNAYYNFTSDFGPGVFVCTDGRIIDGLIKLKSKTSILTIINVDGKYVIKSHLER